MITAQGTITVVIVLDLLVYWKGRFNDGGEDAGPAAEATALLRLFPVVEGQLRAGDGPDARVPAGARVGNQAGQAVVVGQRQGVMAQRGGAPGQRGGRGGPVEQTVVGMGVQFAPAPRPAQVTILSRYQRPPTAKMSQTMRPSATMR